MAKAKQSPHLRVTTEDLKWRYQKGFLTVRGYIYDYLLAAKRKGWRLRTTVKEFCQELEISRPAFYKAISDLRTDAELNFRFEIHGEIEMWIGTQFLNVSTNVDSLSLNVDRNSTNVDKNSTNVDKNSTNVDKNSTNVENEILQAIPNKRSHDSPDLDQIYFNSNQISLSSPPPSSREGDLEIDDLENTASKQLTNKQNQKLTTNNSLPSIQIGEDPLQVPQSQQLCEISFLDWVKHYKASHAKNPTAYTKSCITRDDGTLKAEYEAWLRQRLEPCFSTYKPEPFVPPDPEVNKKAIAEARKLLQARGVLPCP